MRMFSPIVPARSATIILTVALLIAAIPSFAAQQADPAASQKQYDMIVSHLDTGGDLLVVANVDGIIEQGINTLVSFLRPMAEANPGSDSARAIEIMDKLPAFLNASGLYAINGMGMSVRPYTNNLNQIRSFVGRDRDAVRKPLWLGLVGGRRRNMTCLNFLPADTEMVRASTGEIGAFWKLVRDGVEELASPEGVEKFDASIQMASAMLGLSVDELIGSLGKEGFISIQLSRTAKTVIPTPPNAQLEVPTPTILIAIEVTSPALANTIKAKLQPTQEGAPSMLMTSRIGDVEINTINFPMPLPIPFQPTFATVSNVFLLGTTADVVKQAISAASNKDGMLADPAFKKAFEGLPMKNNGVMYMSPRFAKTITDLQTQLMQAMPSQGGDEQKAVMDAVQKLISQQGEQVSAFVVLNSVDGVEMRGTSTSSGSEIIASMAIAPAGLMAAIAIPSFMKARESARGNACINNLRMIDAAKDQYALEFGGTEETVFTAEQISQYIKNGFNNLKCPKGGTYSINKLIVDPACSVHGTLEKATNRRRR